MTTLRDDFNEAAKRTLAARVGNVCSNPDCRALTSGPQQDSAKALNLGVAAHITAASQDGPRYDASLTAEQRCHADNGIWLCQNCAKLADNDVARFSVNLLRAWKEVAEDRARNSVGKTAVQIRHVQVPTQRPTDLVIHEEPGSALYVETPAGAANATANYFQFRVEVENRGPENSVSRKFVIAVEGVGEYNDLRPIRKHAVQTRTAQMMLQPQSTLGEASLVVEAHNVWRGILLFQVGALPIISGPVRCTLKITDGKNSTAEHTFALPLKD
jgi:hypothetical protein